MADTMRTIEYVLIVLMGLQLARLWWRLNRLWGRLNTSGLNFP
jgi:hypothetical protein